MTDALLCTIATADEAVAKIASGSTVLVAGWSTGGPPTLVEALARTSVQDLTLISTSLRYLRPLLDAGKARRVVSSFDVPYGSEPGAVGNLCFKDGVEYEICPQGLIAERLHAGASGVAAFYVEAGIDTWLARGREQRVFDGRPHLLETAIRGDVALIHANTADRLGNLIYRLSSKNFNPVMALAANHVICETERLVNPGDIEPDHVHTPAACVDCLVVL